MGDASYRVPAGHHRVEDVVARSRFVTTLAHAPTAAAAHAVVAQIRDELPDATHHCWAFVAGSPGSTTHIGLSDAGEPKGTAGRPILTVLLYSGIGEVVAVSSRWFGGTKLGTGGLAHQRCTLAMPRPPQRPMRADTVAIGDAKPRRPRNRSASQRPSASTSRFQNSWRQSPRMML